MSQKHQVVPSRQLELDRILDTIKTLSRRIRERFPQAALAKASDQLLGIGIQTKERIEWITQPMIILRFGLGSFFAALLLVSWWAISGLEGPNKTIDIAEFVSLLEASLNGMVVIGAAGFFLFTLETRVRRRRAMAALHELRALAHIIDMHQLTKDPDRIIFEGEDTKSSPQETMTAFEMGRYLDYCSELLSLTGKVAAVYAQSFQDREALQAVNDVESLTTGLSRKIFQKIMILTATYKM